MDFDRVQSRRRINGGDQENVPTARIAAKAVINPKPAPRTAFGNVGNQPQRTVPQANTGAIKKTKIPLNNAKPTIIASKTTSSTRAVFGKVIPEKKDGLLKVNVVNKVTTKNKSKPQIKDGATSGEIKHILPSVQNIIQAFHSGKVIQRTTYDQNKPVEIDIEDDPQLVSEYVKDIIKYLLEIESKYKVPANHLGGHAVNKRNRAVLINWLAEVTESFRLTKETLHISVALVDRYLAINQKISKDKLQLVGVAAMIIAHKYEEMVLINIDDWLYICDNAFTRSQIRKMEMDMLRVLNFSLGRPTSITFLRRYSKVVVASLRQHELSKYLIDLALMDYEMAWVKPSMQAAAACCLSRWLLEVDGGSPSEGWCEALTRYSGHKYTDIANLVAKLGLIVLKSVTSKEQYIRELHFADKRHCIARDESLNSTKLKKLAATVTTSSTKT